MTSDWLLSDCACDRTVGGSSWCPEAAPGLASFLTSSYKTPTSASVHCCFPSERGFEACPPPRTYPILKHTHRGNSVILSSSHIDVLVEQFEIVFLQHSASEDLTHHLPSLLLRNNEIELTSPHLKAKTHWLNGC